MIRFARKRAELSQTGLAALVPYSRQTISIYERKNNASIEAQDKIFAALNTTYEEIDRLMPDYQPPVVFDAAQMDYQAREKREQVLMDEITRLNRILGHREERLAEIEPKIAAYMQEVKKLYELIKRLEDEKSEFGKEIEKLREEIEKIRNR